MYIPPYFTLHDSDETLAFMQRYSFATIITAVSGQPSATHLPFIVARRSDAFVLTSHMAAANPQAQLLSSGEVLVIFSEPHAYISPQNYERVNNVPTWNYMAVHCYGRATFLESNAEKIGLLEQMISFYEEAYLKQWKGLSEKYKQGMLKEITAFEIVVTRIEAKAKLSQNKTHGERENIIKSLEAQPDSTARGVAEEMKKRQ